MIKSSQSDMSTLVLSRQYSECVLLSCVIRLFCFCFKKFVVVCRFVCVIICFYLFVLFFNFNIVCCCLFFLVNVKVMKFDKKLELCFVSGQFRVNLIKCEHSSSIDEDKNNERDDPHL